MLSTRRVKSTAVYIFAPTIKRAVIGQGSKTFTGVILIFMLYALFSNGYVSFEDYRKVSFETMLKSLCCLCLRHLDEQLAFQSEFTFQEILAPHL